MSLARPLGLAWPCSVLLAVNATPAGAAGPLDQPRNALGVIRAEELWVAALADHDVARLEQILAPDFVDISWQGAIRTRSMMIDALRNKRSSANSLSGLTVQIDGDTAIARGLNTIAAADGSTVARIRFSDVFRYRGARWVAIGAQETLERATEPAS